MTSNGLQLSLIDVGEVLSVCLFLTWLILALSCYITGTFIQLKQQLPNSSMLSDASGLCS